MKELTKIPIPIRFNKLIGKTFDRITVVKYLGHRKNNHVFLCQCICGKECQKYRNYLNTQRKNSCGCLRRENSSKMATNRLPVSEGAKRVLFRDYKRNAKKRDIPFKLTLEQFGFLTKGNCNYCNQQPSKSVLDGKSKLNRYNGDYIYNGIDRLDSNKGYVVSNCTPCCWRCNISKGEMTNIEFEEWVKKVYTYLASQNRISEVK